MSRSRKSLKVVPLPAVDIGGRPGQRRSAVRRLRRRRSYDLQSCPTPYGQCGFGSGQTGLWRLSLQPRIEVVPCLLRIHSGRPEPWDQCSRMACNLCKQAYHRSPQSCDCPSSKLEGKRQPSLATTGWPSQARRRETLRAAWSSAILLMASGRIANTIRSARQQCDCLAAPRLRRSTHGGCQYPCQPAWVRIFARSER